MKYSGKIVQIITWEERREYWSSLDDPKDGEYDFLNVMPEFQLKQKWYHRAVNSIHFVWIGPRVSLAEFALMQQLCYGAKRPHDYRVGDIITVDISISEPIQRQNQSI